MRKITTCLLSTALFFAGSLVCRAVPITDLSEISDLGGSYELTADAVVPDDFTPIGSSDAPFTGKFDGGSHTVSISGKAGLFGTTENAEIRNVAVCGTASGSTSVGGIAAIAKGTTVIENCTFDGYLTPDVSGFTAYAGGIAGTTDKKTVIRNCKATVKATLSDTAYLTDIGGIVGLNRGSVSGCRADGKLSAEVSLYRLNIGGIAGENRGDITGSINTASVSGTAAAEGISVFAGGITGYNTGALCRVENEGKVSASGESIYPGYAGGIAGANVNGTITLAKNGGSITSKAAFIGGGVGLNLGYKSGASLVNTLNTGALTGANSIVGGVAANNTKTAHEESNAGISSSLNIGEAAGIGMNTASLSDIYNTGKEDGLSTSVSEAALRRDGVPALEGVAEEWVANTDISALPDLLIVRDESTPELIASTGAADKRAYCLYTPASGTDARAFYAVYYDGARYLSSSAVTAEPQNGFTRLIASNIPENATKIRFIAFESTLSDGIRPASVAAAEISLVEQEEENSLKGKNIVCIGDSLTEGDYGSNPAGTMNVHAENYPYFLAEITGANVKNAGRCGYSAELYYNNQLSKVALSEETDLVLIMLGTNNGLTDTIDADTSASHYASYAKTQTGYYARIIETCMERTNGQAQIILMTPPVTTQRNRTSLETTVSVIKKFGEKYGLPVIDNYYACGITYENIGKYMPIDELHCGYTGYKLLANYIASRASDIYKDFKPESYALSYKTVSEPVGYMGRWFDKDVNGVTCKATFSQGAEFYFKVSGTSKVWLKLHSTASPAPVIAVSTDGGFPKRMTTVKEGRLLLAENLSENEHTFRIIVDGFNEYQEKWTSAMGFVLECPEVEDGGKITGLLPTNPVILYYGDSITEGINVLGTGSTPDSNSASNEYPFIASHRLNAVSYTNGFGASGVTRGGSGGVPKCLDVIDSLYNGMPLSETPAPAAIVINHGHNDPTSDSAAFTEAYTAVLNRLREKYPNTPIFAVSPFAGMHNADIKAVVEALGDNNVFFVDKPSFSYTTSDGAHPDKNGAKALGTYLAQEICNRISF